MAEAAEAYHNADAGKKSEARVQIDPLAPVIRTRPNWMRPESIAE